VHDLTVVLGITAALLQSVAYLMYAAQTKIGRSSPKSASWGIWVFLTIVNALTFGVMSGSWLVTLQFFAGSVACVALFLYMLAIGKLSWPTSGEWGIVGLGILATVVWWIFRDAAYANLIICFASAIAFKPMYEELWRDPRKETPRSWVLWTLAFLVTTVNVVVNWQGKPLNLVMPVGGAILHGTVAYLSRESRRIRFEKASDPWRGWSQAKCPRCGSDNCHNRALSLATTICVCKACGFSDTQWVGFARI
jgi:hypothetical protein